MWLAGQLKAHASQSVEYWRGAESVTVQATIGRTFYETYNDEGIMQRMESRDFMIALGDLVIGGEATTPQLGDRIREVQGGVTVVYEVMSPGQEPHYQYADHARAMVRIHTKGVG